MFSDYPIWKMKALLLKSNICKRRLETGQHEIFPRNDMSKNKYFELYSFHLARMPPSRNYTNPRQHTLGHDILLNAQLPG